MKHLPSSRMIATVSFLVLAVGAAAQEKRVRQSDLPLAVQKAVQEQSKGATIRGFSTEVENGRREYEAEMIIDGHSRDITFAPDGKVLEIEEQVEIAALPAPVREGLQAKAGRGIITRIESLTKNGRLVAYEAQVRTAGKRSEIQVGPDGKPLAHPE